jgi:hypothetical protein
MRFGALGALSSPCDSDLKWLKIRVLVVLLGPKFFGGSLRSPYKPLFSEFRIRLIPFFGIWVGITP